MSDEFSAQKGLGQQRTADGYEVRPGDEVWYPLPGGAVKAYIASHGKAVLIPQYREGPVSSAYADSGQVIEAMRRLGPHPLDNDEVQDMIDYQIKHAIQRERAQIIDGLHPQPPGQWAECMRTGFQAGVNKLKELIRARPL